MPDLSHSICFAPFKSLIQIISHDSLIFMLPRHTLACLSACMSVCRPFYLIIQALFSRSSPDLMPVSTKVEEIVMENRGRWRLGGGREGGG